MGQYPSVVCLTTDVPTNTALVRRGLRLEFATLAWNVVGVVILAYGAWSARSVALAGFGFDTLVEIGASAVVVWELTGVDQTRRLRALRWIGTSFVVLIVYVVALSAIAFVRHVHPDHSAIGIAWTGATAVVMFALAAGKARAGRALDNPVLVTEGRVTFVDALLALAVLIGLALNAVAGWWWADPLAALVIVYYAQREAREAFTHLRSGVTSQRQQ